MPQRTGRDIRPSATDAARPVRTRRYTIVGFLTGYRLLPVGHQHLQRAPMSPGHMIDFVITAPELARILPAIDKRLAALPLKKRRFLLAAIYAHQWGSACDYDFEILNFLYAAFDAIVNFHEPPRPKPRKGRKARTGKIQHWEQAGILCRHLKIKTPSWARKHTGKTRSTLSVAQNALTYDALFAGHPLGYAIENKPLNWDLRAVVSRAIVAALGVDCDYITTDPTDRQMVSLDLKPRKKRP